MGQCSKQVNTDFSFDPDWLRKWCEMREENVPHSNVNQSKHKLFPLYHH